MSNFAGLMGYEGHTVTKPDKAERTAAARAAMQILVDTKHYLEKRGVAVGIMSGGGTGTFNITGSIPEMTEVQAGSYVLMDSTYGNVEGIGEHFERALSVLATGCESPGTKPDYRGYRFKSTRERVWNTTTRWRNGGRDGWPL